MPRFIKGKFKPKNPQKYIGDKFPTYRSSWELKMFMQLDENPNVVKWASEMIAIPYVNPLKPNVISHYYPDLLVTSIGKNNKQITELIEIKPLKQAVEEKARTIEEKIAVLVNKAKWEAAQRFCKLNKIIFRVITERNLNF